MSDDKNCPGGPLLNSQLPESQNANDLKSVPDEEIVASNPSEKSWKGIAIAILVILAISGVIILAIYITSPELFHGPRNSNFGTKLTFRDYFVARSRMQPMVMEWIGNDYLSYVDENMYRKLMKLDSLEETDVILKTYIEEKKSSSSSISISQDRTYLMLSYNHNANFRHSQTAQYTIFDIKDFQMKNDLGLTPNSEIQNAAWSPSGHAIAFAYLNHLYYTLDPMNNSKITSITKTLESSNYITYGVADWLYEEEILRVSKAFWWSPDSSCIAFLSFNDKFVADYKIKVYGGDNHENINGDYLNVKYPKAGQVPRSNNSVVNIFVHNLSIQKTFEIPLPKEIPKDYYVSMVKWIDANHLLIGWLNREQNHAWISVAKSWNAGDSKVDSWVIYEEKVENGWCDMLKQTSSEPLLSENKKKIYLILNRITKGTEYRNIAELTLNYNTKKLAVRKWVVFADFDFTDLLYHNNDYFYFTANNYSDAKQLHLFRASKPDGQLKCMSCDNPKCLYNQYQFKPNGEYLIQSCLGPDIPKHNLIKLNNNNNTLSFVKVLINNTDLREMLSNKSMPNIEFHKITIKVNETSSIQLETKMMLPNTLNKKHVTKYPLLLSVYAGPSSQLVTKKFVVDWHSYLVSSLNIIVLFVDGRGTTNQGRAFERAVYKKLGVVEIHDQLKAAEEISKMTFINKSKIAAYGWSYGGYTVGHLMGHPDNSFIRCGISVAPVSSFDYYDTAYTERYLGLKENDKNGVYKQTDVSLKARNFNKKNYLLVHGTKDDNVHFLNTARLIQALVANDIMFDVMVYPDKAHTLMGGRTHIHVFRKMTSFLMNCYNETAIENRINLFQ